MNTSTIKKLSLGALVILSIFTIYRYSFLIIFWLFTPKDAELTNNEKELFLQVKKAFNTNTVFREPTYNLFHSKDSVDYCLIIRMDCVKFNHSFLDTKARQLKNQLIQMRLTDNMKSISIIYECIGMEDLKFEFILI